MQEITLEELTKVLLRMPLMVEMKHPLSVAFLPEEVKVYADAWEMIIDLDRPDPQESIPMLALGIEPRLSHRLPRFRCLHDPLTSELNRVLLSRYEFIKAHLLCQSQIGSEILSQADAAEAIVLILVDGLSYADIKRHAAQWLLHTSPILVDGVSITEQGMRRVIGDPPLAARLFDKGFSPLGFTYWERPEEYLTDQIFRGFGHKIHKVRSFEEVGETLKNQDLKRAYVQIVRMGLDGVAHRHRDKPNIPATISAIMTDFEVIIDIFRKKQLYAHLYLTSDHGILWKWEHQLETYENNPSTEPLRYYEYARHNNPHTLNTKFAGRDFALLEYPYLRRKLRSNEWGVHGGLSFEESIVPLIKITINPS